MNESNGVIRIGRKGKKKFAIGDEDDPRKLPVFEVDVVNAMQGWFNIDEEFRPEEEDEEGRRRIPNSKMIEYHAAAQSFVEELIWLDGKRDAPIDMGVTPAEALEFIALLREQYDILADFFQPRSQRGREQLGSSVEASMLFSEEVENSTGSTS